MRAPNRIPRALAAAAIVPLLALSVVAEDPINDDVWIKGKLRVGPASGSTTNPGTWSFAIGSNADSVGWGSNAIGYGTTAWDDHSVAIGAARDRGEGRWQYDHPDERLRPRPRDLGQGQVLLRAGAGFDLPGAVVLHDRPGREGLRQPLLRHRDELRRRRE